VELKLERCTIRDWRLEDAPSLTKHANNRRVWLGLRDLFPHPYAIENAHEFLRQATAEKPTTKFCIDIEGAAAGGIGIRIGEDVHRHVGQLGYWLGEEFWGRGIMTEAVSEFVNYASRNFRSIASTPKPTPTIPPRRACWKKPGSLWRDDYERTSSRTGKFSIRSSTRRQTSTHALYGDRAVQGRARDLQTAKRWSSKLFPSALRPKRLSG
jgi:Acetyltransferase (GNAT) domain